jgi:Leucine-rich repeat (LRR) protein
MIVDKDTEISDLLAEFNNRVSSSNFDSDDSPESLKEDKQSLKVEELDLSRRRIESIDKSLFKKYNLEFLKKLDVSNNCLRPMAPITFIELRNLENLNLSKTQLDSVYEAFFNGLASLRYLDLSDNRISWIPSNAFNQLRNLEVLNLHRNQIIVSC